MSNRTPAEVFPPGEFIRDELSERGWTQSDLAQIMGRPVSAISLIMTGKKSVTPETAVELSQAFGTSPEFWLNLESAYQLWRVTTAQTAAGMNAIRDRAKLFESAPVKEMERRGWIRPTSSIDGLRHQLNAFFSAVPVVDKLRVAARTSVQSNELNAEQLAWCLRALQLAKSVPAKNYSDKAFDEGILKLRGLADFPENVRRVPKVLSEMGIRFVLVEHLPKSKIDGAALWLGDGWDKPVVALSLRYDRIDSFWHTLLHECAHIKNKDSYVLDVDLVGADRCLSKDALSEVEARANKEASDMLIPSEKLQSFIVRTRPFYYRSKIIQFANLIKLHPGIIAGQLQHRGEIDWSANREMLVKVRDILISAAMTDGWGVRISKAT